MRTRFYYFPGEENSQKGSGEQNENTNQDKVEISLPRIDRPEGPFEHSGEVAGWTAEEAREKKEQQEQQENPEKQR